MKRILFIGRFQPLHLGHLSVIKNIINSCDELVIAIGSAENSYEKINPFTANERFEMILLALKSEKIPLEKVHIIPIRDIGNDKEWVNHVKKLCPNFQTVCIGMNKGYEYIKKLFENSKVPVKVFTNILDIESSMIRKKIINNDNWEEYIHPIVVEYIISINGIERIKELKEGNNNDQ